MKYCSNCGAEVNENADVCTNCGCLLDKKEERNSSIGKTLGIIGLFVWLIPIAGWIISGIGLSKAKEEKNGSAIHMNTVGLVLSTVNFIISFIILL